MKKGDFLSDLLDNAPRARLLRAFFLDSERAFSLQEAGKRAGLPPKVAAREIAALVKFGIVKKGRPTAITLANGTKRVVQAKQRAETWMANAETKQGHALCRFIHETSPRRFDSVVDSLKRSGRLSAVVLSGFFMGDPTRPTDILLAGDSLNEARLAEAVRILEPLYGRELRYAVFSTPELRYRLTIQDRLIRDTLDYPHLVLLDRAHLL